MNKQRRKDIRAAITKLESVRDTINEAAAMIADAASGEREYYENMPENMQQGERGENASQAADTLENASTSAESLPDTIEEIIAQLEEVEASE